MLRSGKYLLSVALLLFSLQAGAISVSFRLGVCCNDDEGTTGCNSTVCTGDSDCSGGKVCAGSSIDDRDATSSDTVYPPAVSPLCSNSTPTLQPVKNEFMSTFDVVCAQITFHTSPLPDDAVLTSANLQLFVEFKKQTDDRSLTGEYHTLTTCSDLFSASCGSDAFSVNLNSFLVGNPNFINLQNITSISKTGDTGFRLCISGGQPTGENSLIFSAYDSTSHEGPVLNIEYDPAATFTPVDTNTPTSTSTSTSTSTVTNTPVDTATPTRTLTPTDTFTPSITPTPANTPTVTNTPTPFTMAGFGTAPFCGGCGEGSCCCGGFCGAPHQDTENLFVQGCYTGNGQDDRKIFTGMTDPGFLMIAELNANPVNESVMVMRIPEAVGDDSCYLINDGDTCRPNFIQAQSTGGYFQVGTADEVNRANDVYCYYQWSLGPNHTTFSYTGDGNTTKTIDIGMLANFAYIKSTANSSGNGYIRSDLMAANQSFQWNDHLSAAAADTTHIRAFSGTSIEVGASLNSNGVVYWGAAWKEGGVYGDNLTWTGNGNSAGSNCATSADVQTVTASCGDSRNVITSQCTSESCEGEGCATQTVGLAVIRGRNIGNTVVGAGNISGDDFYAQSATRSRDGYLGNLVNSTFDARGEAIGSNSANDLGAKYYGFVTCAPGPTITTTRLSDWSPGFIAVWHMEEANNATRTNNDCNTSTLSGGTIACGFGTCDCDLNNVGTVSQDTTNKRIGSASASFTSTDSEYLQRSLSIANELNISGNHSLSWGAYARATSDSANRWVMLKANNDYSLFRGNVDDVAVCDITMTGGTLKESFTNAGGWPSDSSWRHLICVHDSVADTLKLYSGAVVVPNTATTVTSIRDDSATVPEFRVGRSAASVYWDGQIDEAFVYDGVLSTTDMCRICSCGITGGACSCFAPDPTTFVDTGWNATMCNNCTLPACNKSGVG